MRKFIFVTGGVVSGLGKGITAASLGALLKARGISVSAQKLDPYMNVDPGTMSPFEHGEVFVTYDGAETDLDLGHYERFMDVELNQYSNLTSGKVYWNILSKERNGEFLGKTIQVIPHITNEIKRFILDGAKNADTDVIITEIGGTIGDIESQPFLEAIRQLQFEIGKEHCLFIHVTLVPYLACSGEHKSKPTQHSVKELQSLGIRPDIIIARTEMPLDQEIKEKIALFCNVKQDCVIENLTMPCLYEAPLMLSENGLDTVVVRELHLPQKEAQIDDWKKLSDDIHRTTSSVSIALVGKYVKLHDAYLSVNEALKHAGYYTTHHVQLKFIDSETVTPQTVGTLLKDVDGVLIPGGFGNRGIEGKITTCQYAREHNLPYFGICLGMQIAVIEFARNKAHLHQANSAEFDPSSPYKVIDLMPDQQGNIPKGGTMRLGNYPCKVSKNSLLYSSYAQTSIIERHRHRYEFNNAFKDILTQQGLVISGTSPDDHIVEVIELPQNDFFIGVQFHPEFKSRPRRPHPLFLSFVKAAILHKNKQ